MNFTQEGIRAITAGNFSKAFKTLSDGFFLHGETQAGCYLAQMFYDTRITPRTEKSLMKAMILWHMTKEEVPSSRHKMGVTLFGSKIGTVKDSGLNEIKNAAREGYPVAHCVLGVLDFEQGLYDSAVEHFRFYTGIEKDEKALYRYGKALMLQSSPDYVRADVALTACVRNFDNEEAMRDLVELYSKPDFLNSEKYMYYLTELERRGLGEAAYQFGMNYYFGHDWQPAFPEEKDHQKAYYYLSKTLDMRIREGDKINLGKLAFMLGIMLGDGDGCGKDVERALAYLNEAEKMGVSFPMKKVPLYLEQGDFVSAMEELLKAEKRGDEVPMNMLLKLQFALRGTAGVTEETIMQTALRLEEAYLSGREQNLVSSPAAYLGMMYYQGEGVEKDCEKAERYLSMSDDERAYCTYGIMVLQGECPGKIPKDCIPYFQKAIELGDKSAKFLLGIAYRSIGMNANAVAVLTEAYQEGERGAAKIISDMYLCGEVTGYKNKKMAKEWARKAGE